MRDLGAIDIYWRTDCCTDRNRVAVLLADSPFEASDFISAALPAVYANGAREVYRTSAAFDTTLTRIAVAGGARFVRIVHLETNFLSLAEVEVYPPQPGVPLGPVALDVRPSGADEDSDGLTNGAEIAAGTDPFRDDAGEDPDNDGRTNAQEIAAGTGVNDPDSDDDGLNDGAEFTAGSNPLNPDTDGDGLRDGLEPALGTNPVLADTDGDTLSDGVESGLGRISVISDGARTWLAAKADAESRGGHLLTLTSAGENMAFLTLFGANPPTAGAWIGHTDRFIEGAFRTVTGEQTTFTNFGPGEPNNSGNEDAVQLRNEPERRWNDAPDTGFTAAAYILETGFYTNPLVPDSDGDGVRDDADNFPGQINRAPVTVADAATGNPDAPILIPAGDLLNDDSDPDGDPFVLVSVGIPANGIATLENNGGQVRYVPNTGFSGPDSFTYTIMEAGGLSAEGTVNITIGSNHPPVAGAPLIYDNRALQFDGSDDVASGPALSSITNNFTMEFWARPAATRSVTGETTAGTGGLGGQRYAIMPRFYPDPEAGAGVSVGTNGITVSEHSVNYVPTLLVHSVVLSDWTHVAVVYTDRTPSLFINGVLVRTGLTSSRASVHPSAEVSTSPSFGSFAGSMDEIRVWDHARTAEEITSAFQRRVSGGEPGLAVYWRMDEQGGTALLDSSPAGRDGTLSGGTARVTPGAPISTQGQNFTVLQDVTTPLALSGSDEDGNTLTARIVSLPPGGRLFQVAAGGGAGAEITSVPAAVTSASRVVLYEPSAGFTGTDVFSFTVHDGIDESFPALALISVVPAFAPVTDDLWDASAGTVVTGTSGMPGFIAPADMFGTTASGGLEIGNTLFADGRPAGFTHFIEWQSGGFVRLEGARLFADNDGSGIRGFTEARLFGRLNPAETFTLLATFRPGANPYLNNPLRTELTMAPFVGREWRAEFDQFGSGFGPRIQELDAIGEAVVMIPTPAEVTLQNATSDRSQGGFTPVQLIDGIVVGGQHGWAGDVGGTPSMTAVFETAESIGATADTEFTFGMPQPFGGQHFIGCFRISATTDSRSEFADGLINGGDVSANWTVLDPVEVTSTGGETITILPDKSILIGGAMPATTTYTVRAKGITGGVTGFRLELLEHPSLPNNGPGRVGHGNWVLAEFTVDQEGAVFVANRAPQGVADTAQTPQGIPVTTGNVLANDIDPEGDAITVFDFTQPAAGTGSVVNNGNGTFTWTSPNGAFTGEATFTYRPADAHQAGRPGTVTINVLPSPERVWTNAAGGNWNNSANWLDGNIPGPDDIAVIDLNGTYTVTLDASSTVSQLRLGGTAGAQTLNLNGRTLSVRHAGAVTGTGTLAIRDDGRLTVAGIAPFIISGSFLFEQGVITTGGRVIIAAGGTGTISTVSTKYIDGVLENRGTLTYSGNDLRFGRDAQNLSARIENAAGGTFIVDGEGDFRQHNSGPNYRIDNAGTFIKRGAGTVTTVNSPVLFASTGTVQIESGILEFNHATSLAGTVTGADAIRMVGGSHSFGAGMTTDATNLLLTDSTLSIAAGVAPGLATAEINGSTLNIADSRSLTNLTIRADGRLTMQNSSEMTVDGVFNFSQGVITAGGRVIIATGATGTISTTSTKYIDGVLENRGTLTYNGNDLRFGRDAANLSARIENAAGGVFIVDGEGDFRQHNGGPNYRIDNAGTFIKRGAGTVTTVNSPVLFASTGTVQIESGILEFTHTTSLAGTVTGADAIRLVGGSHNFGAGLDIDSTGITLNSTTLSIAAGAAPGLATVDINGSTLNIAGSRSLTGVTIRADGRLTIQNDSTLTVTGAFDFPQGVITAGGRVIIAAGATGTISTTSTKYIDGVLENRGTLTYNGNDLRFGRDAANLSARIENAAGGVFIVDGEGDFRQHNGGPNYRIDNAGTFIKRGAGTVTTVNAPVSFNSTGAVVLESGALSLHASGSLGGTWDLTGSDDLRLNAATYTLLPGVVLPRIVLTAATLVVPFDHEVPHLALESDSRVSVAAGLSLTVSDAFELSQGVITAGGRVIIAAGATGTISTTSTKYIDGVLENRGTLTYTGNDLRFGRDAQNLSSRIENAAGGVFIVDGEGDFRQHNGGPNYRIDNAGTFIKRGAGTVTTVNAPVSFNSTGAVVLESGALSLHASGSLGGTWDLTGSDDLQFNTATFTLLPGVVLPRIVLTAATLVVPFDHEVPHLGLESDSRVSVAAGLSLTVSGAFDLSQGVITAGGRVIIAAGAAGTISGASTKYIDGVLENRGTLTYTGNDLRFGRDAQNLSSRIENAAGGVFIVDGEGDFRQHNGGPNYRIDNAGTFIKRGAGTVTTVNAPVSFNSTGAVVLESGALSLHASGSLGGTWDLAGSDDLRLNTATFTLLPGVVLPRIVLTAATLVVPFDHDVPHLGLESDSRVSVAAGVSLTVSDAFELSQGVITAGGRVIIAAGAAGTISGASTKYIDGVLENRGTLTYTGNDLRFGRDVANLSARIENIAGGVFIVDGEGDFAQHNGSPNYRIVNAGTFIKRGAGTTTVVNSPVIFATTGTVQMDAGTLQLSNSLTNPGTIAGTGTLVANVTNDGTVRPDATPGGLTIQGNYTQTAAGRLELTLRAADVTLGHRSLIVTGAASLNGTLAVTLAAPFDELQNAVLPVVSFASRSGDFSAEEGLTGNFGYSFSRAFTATTLDLAVLTKGDVPAPPGPAFPPPGFEHWMNALAEGHPDNPLTGADDDADGDGAANFLEYASGSNPFAAADIPKIVPLVVGLERKLFPGLEFRRRTDTDSLRYVVESSRDLLSWNPEDADIVSVKPAPGGAPLETVKVSIPSLTCGGRGCYLRLRVEAIESIAGN